MKNIKKAFYEEAYPEKRSKLQLRSGLSFLYNLFRSFEDYREDAVYRLLPGGKTLADIGCGDGNFVIRSLEKYENCFGTDIAGTRISATRKKILKLPKKFRHRIRFYNSDADEKLPFPDRSVSTVTMIASLEHFFDPFGIFEEINRVLDKKGTVIFQVPNLAFLPRRLTVLFGGLPLTSEDDTGWDGGHLHYFTVGSLKDFLADFGYKIDVITCSGVFAPLRRLFVSLLGADLIIRAHKI